MHCSGAAAVAVDAGSVMVLAGRVMSSVIVDAAAVTTSVRKLVKADSVISSVIVEARSVM